MPRACRTGTRDRDGAARISVAARVIQEIPWESCLFASYSTLVTTIDTPFFIL
jgi:hypothetical protein